MKVTPLPVDRSVAYWAYSVESESKPGTFYVVSFQVRDRTPVCECGDAEWRQRECKHVKAALTYRAALRGPETSGAL